MGNKNKKQKIEIACRILKKAKSEKRTRGDNGIYFSLISCEAGLRVKGDMKQNI